MSTEASDALWCCAWSSSGKNVAAAGSDRIIRIYSQTDSSFELTNALTRAHDKTIRSLSFCPRRAQLAAGSFDGTVSIWTASPSASTSASPSASTSVSPSDSLPAAASTSISLKWTCTATLEGHENEVKTVAWAALSNDADEQLFLATCGRDKTVWIWAVEASFSDAGEDDFECLAVLQEHEQDVKCLAWHPQAPLFLTGSYDGSVRAWGPIAPSLDDWIPLGRLVSSLNATVWSIAFSPAGDAVAVALSDGQLLLYSIPERWKSLTEWSCVKRRLFDPVSLSVKGQEQDQERDECCGGGSGGCVDTTQDTSPSDGEDGGCCGGGEKGASSACCQSAQTPPELQIPATELYCVSWNCTGRLIAVATAAHSIVIVDPHTGHVLTQMETAHADEVNTVSWSPADPSLLASCSDDGTLKLWRVA